MRLTLQTDSLEDTNVHPGNAYPRPMILSPSGTMWSSSSSSSTSPTDVSRGFPESDPNNVNHMMIVDNDHDNYAVNGHHHQQLVSPIYPPNPQKQRRILPHLQITPKTTTATKTRRFYSSPLNDSSPRTPLQIYGLEQREPSIVEKPRLFRRFSHALDDIKEDLPLQLDPRNTAQKIKKRRESMLFMSDNTTATTTTTPTPTTPTTPPTPRSTTRAVTMPVVTASAPPPPSRSASPFRSSPPSRSGTTNTSTSTSTKTKTSSNNNRNLLNHNNNNSKVSVTLSRREKLGRTFSILSFTSVRRKNVHSNKGASISQPNLIGSSNQIWPSGELCWMVSYDLSLSDWTD